MTLDEWLTFSTSDLLSSNLLGLSNRKLHLLTVGFLRRVWNQLDSDHTRIAVEATEKFADGRLKLDELVHLRTTDLIDTSEFLWTVYSPCHCCYGYEDDHHIFAGVKIGVETPACTMGKAAFHARDLVAWAAVSDEREMAIHIEIVAQLELFREIAGPSVNPDWKLWRTETVRQVARAIYRDQSFYILPILADALQDAGCNDNVVLSHCREVSDHVRGCWVVDLAMGIGHR